MTDETVFTTPETRALLRTFIRLQVMWEDAKKESNPVRMMALTDAMVAVKHILDDEGLEDIWHAFHAELQRRRNQEERPS